MTYMLETNICIYAIKKKTESVLNRLRDNMEKGLCISSITLAKLQYGVCKSAQPERNAAALMQFLAILEIMPFDDRAAAEYGTLCAYLQKRGTPIETMDMQIAAHARALSLTMVTNNMRECARVPELKMENWATEY